MEEKFIQFAFSLDPSLGEELSSLLDEEALSSSWYEVQPNNWVFQVLFKEDQKSLIHSKIIAFFKEKEIPEPERTESKVENQDWIAAVYRDLPALTIDCFYVYGAHIQDPIPPSLIPLRVDAATAFGSGQHESTQGCLQALSFLAKAHSFTSPLDMGCGSGILALAMAALWKVPVLACDNDPEAVRVTKLNGEKNNLAPLIQAEVSEGFDRVPNKKFDLITANILAGPLCHMAQDASDALSPHGFMILSGLLNRQAEDVIHAYQAAHMTCIHKVLIGEWATLIMQKE